ncbi:tRNA epoxyqueuosine(34) reductase QueG [PVC group bacterium]|nr:tRNA epoxyqueuosine(34) reductase QueG [PVC group bacterium]
MILETQIFLKAKHLGFGAAGIAKSGPSNGYNSYLDWLSDGNAAEMVYLKKHALIRANPDLIAPRVKSIIAVGAGYPVNTALGKGFSSYARGKDYHEILRTKLKSLTGFIKEKSELSLARICIDSAPLLEREWAIRAGLGWRGRQGQVINPNLGACFVLGFLLVDLKLTPSPVLTDRCGDCRKCIEACPAEAINTKHEVDARKCISYMTIEHKGKIPKDFAAKMKGSLFGCDFCTAVCPWNEQKQRTVMPEFAEEQPLPTPGECMEMSETDFKRRFTGSAVYRSGLTRLKRNAAIALG